MAADEQHDARARRPAARAPRPTAIGPVALRGVEAVGLDVAGVVEVVGAGGGQAEARRRRSSVSSEELAARRARRRRRRGEDEHVLDPLLRPGQLDQADDERRRPRRRRDRAGRSAQVRVDAVLMAAGLTSLADSLRHTGRGRWRKTVNTYRNVPGTHTMSFPPARPSATASATASGVVDSGAGSMPSVIEVCTKPGRTTRRRRRCRRASRRGPGRRRRAPALDDAVDEVRLADPLAGDRRQHDDRAVALLLQPPADVEQGRDRRRCSWRS